MTLVLLGESPVTALSREMQHPRMPNSLPTTGATHHHSWCTPLDAILPPRIPSLPPFIEVYGFEYKVVLISLSGSNNGHICTLDSGGVLALHTQVVAMFARCAEFRCIICSYRVPTFGSAWIRRTTPFREAWVLTHLMAFPYMHGLIGYGPSAFTARLPAGVHGMMSIKGEC
jgi:hypothetical protein